MGKTTLDLIQQKVRGRSVLNAPMSEHTTLRVGGPADLLLYPADRDDLFGLLAFLNEREVPCFPLGNGSNLVVRDGGIRGAVLNLNEAFTGLELREAPDGSPLLWVEAGLSLRRLVRWTVDQGIAGFESLTGIPGAVGGALAMNAGAWGSTIGDHVQELEAVDPKGRPQIFDRETLRFEYRSLDLPKGYVILGALLKGERATSEAVKERAQELHRRRRDTQPTQEASAGSVFKNPPGRSAGQLIEECGLKGVRVGDAEVSRIHANFIVNAGKATAGQVVALMGMIQERVYVKYKLKLEPEVRIVGDWEKGKLRIQE
ncbi:MAG: UDP-N-acetylmuramate dehydrogenase [Proteobacteria bacterium]|nr:UDP-N-acetylmuramate dehydrogenase [Pseudomonadota bacterium]